MASDDLRRYPPTARRLERLRQAGLVPSSAALTGAVVLVAATLAVAALGRPTLAFLATMLARDLQQSSVGQATPEQLTTRLASHLSAAATILVAVGVGAMLVAALTHLAQTGFLFRWPGSAPGGSLPWSGGVGGKRRAGSAALPLGLALVGLLGGVVTLYSVFSEWAGAGSWAELGDEGVVWRAWLRWLAALLGLALLHLLWVRASFTQRVQLTQRELSDEIRETEGPWLTRRLREMRRRRRQQGEG